MGTPSLLSVRGAEGAGWFSGACRGCVEGMDCFRRRDLVRGRDRQRKEGKKSRVMQTEVRTRKHWEEGM